MDHILGVYDHSIRRRLVLGIAMTQGGVKLPSWVIDWANKILPWALMGITVAAITLYTDNIGNQRDIARNTWRNDQQDIRIEKAEVRAERAENELVTEKQRTKALATELAELRAQIANPPSKNNGHN